ncbi:D-alanyl-D-alanine carboxypeptidase family protein [Microbacterium sp. YJN-G]|uniref:D-alanyl-D-alanine carboxypeptidase family protein n=1 Tax=Microbacterium sp. YJN-G TaxID=2763257 RepID=UPI0018780A55|nr:D-alanyl-D-alanine carboxypeptidase [Microbacterium sp. YJN-G]
MTVSPDSTRDSTRPLTRRSLRERTRARNATPPAAEETPESGADAATIRVAEPVPAVTASSGDTDAVNVIDRTPEPVEPDEPEPEFLREPATVPGGVPAVVPAVVPAAEPVPATNAMPDAGPVRAWADDKHPTTALTWLDPRTIGSDAAPEPQPAPDLFAGAHLSRGWRRPRALVPAGILTAVGVAYVASTLLWPLSEVAPVVTAEQIAIEPAPAATATWPENGSAAVSVQGIAPLSSTPERDEIASITKVASTLMVLDAMPLKVGEQGPSFEFTREDSREYWRYRWSDQSALDVPVGGSLTEYQMLQGVLLGSANNYIDRLAEEIWGSDRAFAEAAATWLSDHGIEGVSLVNPSGFDRDNVATPAGAIRLAEVAMKNPVFAEIVATRSAEIPGVGTVTNTNKMLDDAGVVGVKTGTLSHWNLLTAKDVPVGDTTVRVYAAVLGQDSNDDRLAVTRQLLAGVEASLAEQPVSVPKGTVVGQVATVWGDRVEVVTDADTKVVLWNGASATAVTELDLGDRTAAGAEVGTLTAKGPVDTAQTSVSLAEEISAPSPWWRLTHPLELFGLDNG